LTPNRTLALPLHSFLLIFLITPPPPPSPLFPYTTLFRSCPSPPWVTRTPAPTSDAAARASPARRCAQETARAHRGQARPRAARGPADSLPHQRSPEWRRDVPWRRRHE